MRNFTIYKKKNKTFVEIIPRTEYIQEVIYTVNSLKNQKFEISCNGAMFVISKYIC